jgi:hypothetical protein
MKSSLISTHPETKPGKLSHRVEIFRYNIASCEMRFIERAERLIHIVYEADGRWLLQGSIPGCGPTCHADLAKVMLEYLLSCEGIRAGSKPTPGSCFSEIVSSRLIGHLRTALPGSSEHELLESALGCLTNSFDAAPEEHFSIDQHSVLLSPCPLCARATEDGVRRMLDSAHRLLGDLYRTTASACLRAQEIAMVDDHRPDAGVMNLYLELKMS